MRSFLRLKKLLNQLRISGNEPTTCREHLTRVVAGAVHVQNIVNRLKKITVPILGIWGEKDNISPPENAETLADHVKNSEAHVIKGGGTRMLSRQAGRIQNSAESFPEEIRCLATIYHYLLKSGIFLLWKARGQVYTFDE
ncbi:MAG: alpha/beta hydrolase [Nitrospirae bacterium]|nr:alpha/beta hydrolase [Nitrospirota bacterium]